MPYKLKGRFGPAMKNRRVKAAIAKSRFQRRYPKGLAKRRPRNSAYGGLKSRYDKERVMLPWNNYQYGSETYHLGAIPAAPSSTAGLLTGALSLVVLQTGENLTGQNQQLNIDIPASCVAMKGFTATSGVKNFQDDPFGNPITGGQIVGKSAIMSSSFLRINVAMNSTEYEFDSKSYFNKQSPHEFRVLMVRAIRGNSVDPDVPLANTTNQITPSLRSNLFIDELGSQKGFGDSTSVADLFNWPINRQKWQVCHDKRFTLKAMCVPTMDPTIPVLSSGMGTPHYPNQKTLKMYLPVPKKKTTFSFEGNTSTPRQGQPLNFNYVYHTIILSRCTANNGNMLSNNWSVQANGCTAVLD